MSSQFAGPFLPPRELRARHGVTFGVLAAAAAMAIFIRRKTIAVIAAIAIGSAGALILIALLKGEQQQRRRELQADLTDARRAVEREKATIDFVDFYVRQHAIEKARVARIQQLWHTEADTYLVMSIARRNGGFASLRTEGLSFTIDGRDIPSARRIFAALQENPLTKSSTLDRTTIRGRLGGGYAPMEDYEDYVRFTREFTY